MPSRVQAQATPSCSGALRQRLRQFSKTRCRRAAFPGAATDAIKQDKNSRKRSTTTNKTDKSACAKSILNQDGYVGYVICLLLACLLACLLAWGMGPRRNPLLCVARLTHSAHGASASTLLAGGLGCIARSRTRLGELFCAPLEAEQVGTPLQSTPSLACCRAKAHP